MSITLIILIMTCAISYQALQNPTISSRLLFYPYEIKRKGEFFRFLTSGFVHGSWPHLFINVFVLYQFGTMAEDVFSMLFGEDYGKIVFIVFYLSAIIVAGIPTYFRHQDDVGYRALGASGATSALVFFYIVFSPWSWFQFPPVPAIVFGILYLAYSSYMDKKGTDNIGHNAHLWGALYGLIFTLVSIYVSRPDLFDRLIAQLLAGPVSPF